MEKDKDDEPGRIVPANDNDAAHGNKPDAGTWRRVDILLSEALDRISRDQEDVAAVFKRLRFAGVTIVTLSEGEISELHVGLKGTMNALFLKDSP